MKKLIFMLLVICLVSVMLIGCTNDKDRAENGRVTDDTTEENLMDDASSAINDMTDALTDDRDTSETSSKRNIGGPVIGDRTN